jgi:hypothetical protein
MPDTEQVQLSIVESTDDYSGVEKRTARSAIQLSIYHINSDNYFYRSHGLTGVPSTFLSLRQELGLVGDHWQLYGAEWQELARKWLMAEVTLVRLVKPPMTVVDVKTTQLPLALQDWAVCQIAKLEFSSTQVRETIGAEMLKWWKGLNVGRKDVDDIFNYAWCRDGQTGIVMLILGMHWWADRSGGGNEWKMVIREMSNMFEKLANAPSL